MQSLWAVMSLDLGGMDAQPLNGGALFCRSLRNLLDGEMEHSAALRQEVDALRRKVTEQQERHATKVQALAR